MDWLCDRPNGDAYQSLNLVAEVEERIEQPSLHPSLQAKNEPYHHSGSFAKCEPDAVKEAAVEEAGLYLRPTALLDADVVEMSFARDSVAELLQARALGFEPLLAH